MEGFRRIRVDKGVFLAMIMFMRTVKEYSGRDEKLI